MKHSSMLILGFALSGCAGIFVDEEDSTGAPLEQVDERIASQCVGTVQLPVKFADLFEVIEDEALLQPVLGEPNGGMLCQGRVYQLKKDAVVTLYRAWNSTNPNSRLGKWWAFDRPSGKVADYRADYEICYQWSPLDKMTHCHLKEGRKVVIGTGQSAECSQYLSYPASAAQQIYIEDADSSLSECSDYDSLFSWEPVGR